MICKICNHEVRNTYALRFHLKLHNMTTQQYYDNFCLKNSEDRCIMCNEKSRFCNFTKGYSRFCSQTCYSEYMKTEDWDKQQKNTKNRHFNNPNFCNSEQAKNTRHIKNSGQYESVESLNKAKETCKKNYGVEHPAQSICIKEKMRNTCKDRYGVSHFSKTDDFKEKFKDTCEKRYGVDSPFKYQTVQEKIKNTCVTKYGTEYPSKCDIIKDKMKTTWLSKYGVDHPFKVHEIYKKTKRKIYYAERYFDSNPELDVYKVLKSLNVDFEYHPDVYFEYAVNDKIKRYYPDFRIKNKYIELKGPHFFNENGKMINPYDRSQDDLYEAKHQCMLDNEIIIIHADNTAAEVICDIFGLHS